MSRQFRALLTSKTASPESGNGKHEWWYFPKMTADEAVIFKQFDSTESESKVCIHAALDVEEDGPQPLPERQSVEVRAFVVYGDETKEGA